MRAAATPNAMPLSRPQWAALLRAAGRQIGWGLWAVSREVRAWRTHAEQIPDPALRRDALDALKRKRGHADGAAMFWTLPQRRDPRLLLTLVRYELLQDFLDSITEDGAALGPEHGEQLYLALGDALDPDRPVSDYYLHHRARCDGGYLAALVEACREGCQALPGYPVVRSLLIREAERASVLIINHGRDPAARDLELRQWAAQHFPHERELCWFELTAAASGWITTHALLALASDTNATSEMACATYAAYFPWVALTLTVLDSYVDQAEDASTGSHNYIGRYPTVDIAVASLCQSIAHAARDVLDCPNGERHGVLLACMVALYLSKDSARSPDLRAMTKEIASAAGTLPRLLLPVLRVWRICNGQRAAT